MIQNSRGGSTTGQRNRVAIRTHISGIHEKGEKRDRDRDRETPKRARDRNAINQTSHISLIQLSFPSVYIPRALLFAPSRSGPRSGLPAPSCA